MGGLRLRPYDVAALGDLGADVLAALRDFHMLDRSDGDYQPSILLEAEAPLENELSRADGGKWRSHAEMRDLVEGREVLDSPAGLTHVVPLRAPLGVQQHA
mmetsp:Transcript_95780/g.265964  ORF Transcript_95780/g.265964 Transcript_95780/m.265964 type:complete len:101 (+) Transcript_95780:394-696(+)